MLRKIIALISILILPCSQFAQVINPVRWEFSAKKIMINTYELKFTAIIDKGWHMYGLNIPPDGPVPTKFTFENENNLKFQGSLSPVQKPETQYDSTFEMKIELFDNRVDFVGRLKVNSESKTEIKGFVTYMTCDNSRCLPPRDQTFSILIDNTNKQTKQPPIIDNSKKDSVENQNLPVNNNSSSIHENKDSGTALQSRTTNTDQSYVAKDPQNNSDEILPLWKIILKALVGGFLAVLTPCVYPIIPLTVSFFMRETNRSKSLFNAFFFGFSIVFIYTMVGLISGLFRFDLVYWIKTQQLPNIIFFLLFILLASSFFGAFELVLPGKLTNMIDQRADKGGLLGPFFMALATVFVSFSCVGPIAGIILGDALRGEVLTPVIGMFSFSLTFALPFTLLAIFPGFIKKMPKSGGWLNSIKVFFAFILLAFSLVFLVNLRLSFITRDIILAVEIVIFFLLGLYFLGKIKFAHDSNLDHLSVPRLILAIASLSFSVYMVPGLFGAPLNAISPFLPEKEQMQFDLTKRVSLNGTAAVENTICDLLPKYSEILTLPLGLQGYFDYNEALACAKKLNKPVLLDFAGHSCKNCKKMYAEVWSDPRVLNLIRNKFIVAVLYTDDNTKLSKQDEIISQLDGKLKNTIGKKFNDLQIVKFNTNTLPLYAIVNSDGKILTDKKYHEYSPDIEDFNVFLNNGLDNFTK
jgi:thiol:disulfide interchange protein